MYIYFYLAILFLSINLYSMIGFFIKKAFFDGWDNLIGIVLYNLISVGIIILGLFASYLADVSIFVWALALALVLLVFCLFSGALSNVCYEYSNYQRSGFSTFREAFGRYFKHSLFYFVFLVLMILIALFVIPFYLSINGIVGIILSVIMLWVMIIMVLLIPYYLALSSYLPGDGPFKTFKKCFLIMADNMGFTIFFLIYNLVMIVLTVITMGFLPGIAGMNLASHDAVKLIMLKYDYIEENPEIDRKHLPWEDILFEEKEKVGPRSFKNMIFPWK